MIGVGTMDNGGRNGHVARGLGVAIVVVVVGETGVGDGYSGVGKDIVVNALSAAANGIEVGSREIMLECCQKQQQQGLDNGTSLHCGWSYRLLSYKDELFAIGGTDDVGGVSAVVICCART